MREYAKSGFKNSTIKKVSVKANTHLIFIKESVGKPSSVADNNLSGLQVALQLKPPHKEHTGSMCCSLLHSDVASDRVYMAVVSPQRR